MGVSISILLFCPSPFFLTLTLQAGRTSRGAKARVKSSAELSSSSLSMRMLGSFLRDLCRPLDAGAALSDVGNADRQMSANGNFTKKSFNGADFRDGCIGKSAEIILYRGKILRHVGISHGQDCSFLRCMVQ